MRKHYLLVAAISFAMSGCFFVSKKPSSTSQPATAAEPKNHGQERSAEVHERNEERKEAKEEAKEEKKADKK
jgi:hypothetical protein